MTAIMTKIPETPVDLSDIIARYFPNAKAPAAREVVPDEERSFFQRVNDHAMADLHAWVTALLPDAQEARKGFRVRSVDLGRALEEDLSIQPEGIVDFGVHDQDDAREGKRTPIELVLEHHPDIDKVADAAHWLCEQIEIEPKSLGWVDSFLVPLSEDEFDPIEEDAGAPRIPAFQRDKRGRIVASIENVCKAMAAPQMTGWAVAFDEFKDAVMLAPANTKEWRGLSDADYTEMRILLEQRSFKPVSKEMMRDAVEYVAANNHFDSAILWLASLTWDGTPRIDTFLKKYFNAEDSEYTRATSRYLWTALAGRIMSPGVQADMMPILIGAQGAGKSTGVALMAPSKEHFFEVDMAAKEDDLARRMRGRLIGEIGELRGLHNRQIEHIKAFITRTHENWVPKFKEFATTFPRRCVFIGTTNQNEFLGDETGERRFLPVVVGTVDREAIARDRLQLWAEARECFLQGGVQWALAEDLAKDVHEQHKLIDPWVEYISTWLDSPVEFSDADEINPERNGERPFTTAMVLREAINLSAKESHNNYDKRAAAILRRLGYVRKKVRIEGRPMWGWRQDETVSATKGDRT